MMKDEKEHNKGNAVVAENGTDEKDVEMTKEEKKKSKVRSKKNGDGVIVKAAKEFQSKNNELLKLKAQRDEIDSRVKKIEGDLVSLKETIKGGIENV
jgi:uncharacterized protein YheU (UPF0270 family)